MSRKGMAYTSFALLASTFILMIALLNVNGSINVSTSDAERIGEASFFMQSIFSDMERALNIAGRRSATAVTNYVVLNGDEIENPQTRISEALMNGTIYGEDINGSQNASLKEWASRVSDIADDSGYSLDVKITNYTIDDSGMELNSSFTVFAQLKDPVTLAQFNESRETKTNISIVDLEDTMLLLRSEGRYINKYSTCSFNDPASKIYEGTQNSTGTAYGRAVVNPSDASTVSNSGEKILVVNDIDSYSTSEVDGFEGAVSAQESSNPQTFSTKYVFGTGSISSIEDNSTLVVKEDDVWQTHFQQMFTQGCYVTTDRGPGFMERLQNEMVSDEGQGIATLIDVRDLPPELQQQDSAVGYVYFNETSSYGGLNDIMGVTDEYSWFHLDQHHVDYWGLGPIAQ